MEEQRFQTLVNALREQEGVEEIFLLNSDGEVIFKSEDFQLSNQESKALLTAWRTNEPAIMFQNNRFAVLKNDTSKSPACFNNLLIRRSCNVF